MPWTTPTDFAAGTVVTEAMLDNLSTNLTTGVIRPIAETTLTGTAASIDFTSIPATFSHLAVAVEARGDPGSTSVQILVRINNDSSGNYTYQRLDAMGSTVTAAEAVASTFISVGHVAAATAQTASPGGYFIIFPNALSTVLNKMTISVGGYRIGASTNNNAIVVGAGFYVATPQVAINRITLLISGANFDTGSKATLYGLPSI